MPRTAVVVGLLVSTMCLPKVQGQAQPPESGHTVTILKDGEWLQFKGTIRNIEGPSLLFETKDNLQIQSIRFSAVREFTFTADPDFAKGLSDYDRRNFKAAEQHFAEALKHEGRDWAKPEILARQAAAMIADNRRKDTLPLFQQILQLDPGSRLLGQLPLVWDESLPESERLQLPPNRLTTGDELTQLAVASCVLHEPEQQRQAVRVLKQLRSAATSPVLSQLATAQLWRLSLLLNDDSAPMLTDVWRGQWNRMSASSRPGPGLVLGQCLQQQHKYDQAALVLMFSPLIHVDDRAIAAMSLKRAMECLNAAGREAEADIVFRELVNKYPQQSAARRTE